MVTRFQLTNLIVVNVQIVFNGTRLQDILKTQHNYKSQCSVIDKVVAQNIAS